MNPSTKLYLEQLKKDAATAGGQVIRVTSHTPSMLGNPYAGNHVVVLPQLEYRPGEDVVFRHGKEKQLLHRITHVKPGYVFTKGTFNQLGDGWIPIADVVGKVTQVVKTKGNHE